MPFSREVSLMARIDEKKEKNMLEGKYNFKQSEEKWQNYWQEKGTYEYK